MKWLLIPKRLLLFLAFLFCAFIVFQSCRTSRTARRSFVLARDYSDLRRILHLHSLPPTFKILRVDCPGVGLLPGPDGPRWIDYQIAVDAKECSQSLAGKGVNQVSAEDASNHAWGPLIHFDQQYHTSLMEDRFSRNPKVWPPRVFESTTTNSQGYPRKSFIVLDERPHHPNQMYVETRVPYEDP